jgi:copper chaperone CopZ|tara:strand:- start:16562 stop:17002 length:441 start_codon:yes stop_codon:yes gene_type:complete
MKVLQIIFVTAILLVSCGQNEKQLAKEKQEKASKEKVVANKQLTFEIEGMVCVMGCGGSIKSKLAETNAVEKCEFDFEEGREKNKVTVSFDKNKTTPEQIIKIVTDMNDGQFKVGTSESGDISYNIKTTIQDVPNSIDEQKTKGHI